MYVKTTGDAEHGDTLWETPGPISSGVYALPFTDDGEGPIFDFQEGLPFVPRMLHIHEIDISQQTKFEVNHNLVMVGFAYWGDSQEGTVGVVTTRNIFIVGANGKTIDKVR